MFSCYVHDSAESFQRKNCLQKSNRYFMQQKGLLGIKQHYDYMASFKHLSKTENGNKLPHVRDKSSEFSIWFASLKIVLCCTDNKLFDCSKPVHRKLMPQILHQFVESLWVHTASIKINSDQTQKTIKCFFFFRHNFFCIFEMIC